MTLFCRNKFVSLVSVVFVSVLGSNIKFQSCYHKPCLAGVQLFSCSFAVYIEDCDAWWFSGGCSSLVVVEAKSYGQIPYISVIARFRILQHNIDTLCEEKLGTWDVENMPSIRLPEDIPP